MQQPRLVWFVFGLFFLKQLSIFIPIICKHRIQKKDKKRSWQHMALSHPSHSIILYTWAVLVVSMATSSECMQIK